MSYKQKSLNTENNVEEFASNTDFTDGKRLGTRVLWLPHGQCAFSLHAKRSLVRVYYEFVNRVCQQRMTAGLRTD